MKWCKIMEEHQLLPKLIRLIDVHGFDARSNDIVYCRPMKSDVQSNLVVFFGGDVQDFTENMTSHRDNKRYAKWNLENTARLLRRKFLDSHIIVVRPSSMELKTFSCFRNFVPCNTCGVPMHKPFFNSLCHLEALISNVAEKLRTMSDEELRASEELSKASIVEDDRVSETKDVEELDDMRHIKRCYLNFDFCSMKLIGFSKGCVVLNQFLHEFHYYKDGPSDMEMMTRIKHMIWLDGGHNGGKNTWITSKPLLETLAGNGIDVHIHVSPYQIRDDRRPWIGKEEKCFYETLLRLKCPVRQCVHFDDLPPDLNLHFEILNAFSIPK